jgi:hypothetical protein
VNAVVSETMGYTQSQSKQRNESDLYKISVTVLL